MRPQCLLIAGLLGSIAAAAQAPPSGDDVRVDLSAHKRESGVAVRQDGARLRITWPLAEGQHGALTLQLGAKEPLIEELGIG